MRISAFLLISAVLVTTVGCDSRSAQQEFRDKLEASSPVLDQMARESAATQRTTSSASPLETTQAATRTLDQQALETTAPGLKDYFENVPVDPEDSLEGLDRPPLLTTYIPVCDLEVTHTPAVRVPEIQIGLKGGIPLDEFTTVSCFDAQLSPLTTQLERLPASSDLANMFFDARSATSIRRAVLDQDRVLETSNTGATLVYYFATDITVYRLNLTMSENFPGEIVYFHNLPYQLTITN